MRIFHTGDVHLGAVPDVGFPWSESRAAEIKESFCRLIRLAQEEKPDVLIIAGDLFHRQPRMSELKEVNYLFSKIPETIVVLTAGNHDYIDRKSFWEKVDWNENVITLFSEKCTSVAVKEKSIRFYGCSYHQKEYVNDLYRDAAIKGNEKYHVLVLHGGDAKHSPFDRVKLERQGFHYIAAGHIHKPGVVIPGKMAYCGALEPLDRNDTGKHGFMDITLNDAKTEIAFVPFAKRSYIDLTLQMKEEYVWEAVKDSLAKTIHEHGKEHFYRITFQGEKDPETHIQYKDLDALGNITEVIDQTRACWDYEALQRKYKGSLAGEFIQTMRQMDHPQAALALEYGMDALFGD